MNMILDFQPLNGHFPDYRNMATKATYYGRDVINEAGAWLRKCFAAQGEELVLFERFMCAGSPRPSHTPSVRLAVHSQCRCLSMR